MIMIDKPLAETTIKLVELPVDEDEKNSESTKANFLQINSP